LNLHGCITAWAAQTPAKTALHFDGEAISYAALRDAALARTEQFRALEIKRGERVALLGYNHPELLYSLFACARLGAILVPLNWRLSAAEHSYVLQDCNARILLTEREFIGACAPLKERHQQMHWVLWDGEEAGWLSLNEIPHSGFAAAAAGHYEDPVLLVYTSGTTGNPKGALLTQAAMLWNAINSQHAHGLHPDDHVLTDLPLFHVGGLNIQTFPALHTGATVTLHRRFDAEAALRALHEQRPSLYLMVPATMRALINHPMWQTTDLSSLRVAMAGSATIPVPLIRAFIERGVAVGQIYGTTETAPIATVLRGADAEIKIGSCGKPATHCEVRVVDEHGATLGANSRGEIQVRGPNLMREYWGDTEQTQQAFDGDWFRTGDIAHWDAEGFLYIDDRKKDVIISGGENIYPAEIENVLGESPLLSEFAVVGHPDEQWGEVPVAVVVPKAGAQFDHTDTEEILDGRLARFKLPKHTLAMDRLPRNAMGKVLKHELRDYVARTLPGTETR